MKNPHEEIYEAEKLLEEIRGWSEENIEELPKLYREKAREYRELAKTSQE